MNKKEFLKFKNEKEEKHFWATHDSADYLDWSKAKKVTLSNLKPSVKNISLRLPPQCWNNCADRADHATQTVPGTVVVPGTFI